MRDQLFIALDVLGSLPSSMVTAVGDQVMSGVISLLKGREYLVKSVSSSKRDSTQLR
jgi:golgi-specific brefeldin A-resistance guanine nucleotide exchange factor 1